jgi:hypothetical protein
MELNKETLPQPAWPAEPHKLGQSLCGWVSPRSKKVFIDLIKKLPPNPVYVELGTFLGAGSTMLALQARSDLQAICLDHWAITASIANKYPPDNAKDKDGRLCAFLRGEGTSLEHCQNNLWAYRDRVTLIQTNIVPETVDQLANQGVKADCVLLDDDHTELPFLHRLGRCRYRWPEAVVICDDYCKAWPGILNGVEAAFRKGFYTKEESQVFDRMIAFQRKNKK